MRRKGACLPVDSVRRNAANPLLRTQIITPYNIYFNAWLILQKLEVWRLFTNFFFFGSLGELQAQRMHCSVPCWRVTSSKPNFVTQCTMPRRPRLRVPHVLPGEVLQGP